MRGKHFLSKRRSQATDPSHRKIGRSSSRFISVYFPCVCFVYVLVEQGKKYFESRCAVECSLGEARRAINFKHLLRSGGRDREIPDRPAGFFQGELSNASFPGFLAPARIYRAKFCFAIFQQHYRFPYPRSPWFDFVEPILTSRASTCFNRTITWPNKICADHCVLGPLASYQNWSLRI